MKLWKRNAVVAAIVLFVCVAVYLNWSYQQDEANVDAGKQFVAFMYSDAAADIFLKGGAVQPINGIVDKLEGDNVMFYSIYDTGASAVVGIFSAYESVAGLGTVREVFLDPVNALVSGQITKDHWVSDIKTASDQMRANLVVK